MNITFIGTGYVGLVSGIMMSYIGHNVTCLDTDSFKISQLKKNILPIYEPTLDEYLLPLINSDTLHFTDRYSSELQNSQVVFITVGTPPLETGEADLQYIFAAIDNLYQWLNNDCLIVIKSTVPPTTCNKIIDYLYKKKYPFNVASNPEFLREGKAVYDFLNPDRILIGTNNKYSEEILKKIYLPLTLKGVELISTDIVTAELAKYAANAFLATKVAFTNEMANLCEKVGANMSDIALTVGSDRRIGKAFLSAGPGFGGSCFPKDLIALSATARKYQSDCTILDSVIRSNEQRPSDMVDKISHIIGGNLENKNFTILGLTFKADTDDIRSSPAIKIMKILLAEGANVKAFDPMGIDNTKNELKDLEYKNLVYSDSALSACQNSDVILITTEWSEFRNLDFALIRSYNPIIIDLRNLLDSQQLKTLGFKYYRLGIKDGI